MKRYAGRVLVDDRLILEWLGFKGGIVHYIARCEDYDAITITIEHPDMPELPEGGTLQIVDPEYSFNLRHRIWPPHISLLRRVLRRVSEISKWRLT